MTAWLRVSLQRNGALASILLDGLRVSDCSGYLTDTTQFAVQVRWRSKHGSAALHQPVHTLCHPHRVCVGCAAGAR